MQVSVREARERLSQLLSAVEHGEKVEITRRGKVVAQLAPSEQALNIELSLEARASARTKLREALPIFQIRRYMKLFSILPEALLTLISAAI